MLSIGKITLGQHRYYEQQVAQGGDDYYSGRGEAPGEWAGAGAHSLGLSGRVSSEQFSALIAGLDPRNPEVRLRASSMDPKVAAFDLTFSAPKSLSVLFAVAPEQVSGVLAACHEDAVRAALGYLEDTAVMVRRGHAGERVEPAAGLVAAAYRHRMSRALDPQLHTHVVAGNLARGSDGRYTALHGNAIYRAAKTAGFLYQAHLRVLVGERLGLEWGEVHKGAAGLEGVGQPVVAEFSKRRQEMERAAQEGGIGLASKAAGESAALATRERKQYGVQTHTWREEVRARAGELGFGSREIADLLVSGRERVARGVALEAGLDERGVGDRLAGAEGLTARSNTFAEPDVLQELAAAAQQGARVQDLRGLAGRFAERVDVLPTSRGEMTTADLVASERHLIASAIARAGEGTAVLDAALVQRAIASASRHLTDEQAAAVRATVAAGDGVSVIQALAGTGKTYTAGVLRELYAGAGYEVLGVAPTGRATRELAEEAGIPARTLDRLLLDIEQLGDELPTGGVLIFDEAGMAATRPTARLLLAAEHAAVKVIAIGDPGQLASVQAGGWLGAVGREVGVHRLTEVMRQRDPGERRALGALHDHHPALYLEWAEQSGRVETFSDPAGACARALDEWSRAAAQAEAGQVVMIARDNVTRDELNRGARELLRGAGRLGSARAYGLVELAVGDRVICRRNDRLIDVDNGTRGTVTSVEDDRILLSTDAGLERALPATYLAGHVEHAYALTGHGMQGATVERALVVASPRDLTAGWSYTALSRARGATRLLVHDQQPAAERSEFAPADSAPSGQRRDLLVRVERRMLERDDEDLAIEQLPAAARPERQLAQAVDVAGVLARQDRNPEGEPPAEVVASPETLRILLERVEGLESQLALLPTRELQRIEDLDARIVTLSAQRQHLDERLAGLPGPRQRLGRVRDPYAVERTHLSSALQAAEREIDAVTVLRARHQRGLGDPGRLRAEREVIERALAQSTRESLAVRDNLAESEVQVPSAWVLRTFGERPDGARDRGTWEKGVRQVARYRAQQGIVDPHTALGRQPEQSQARRDWERAREAIEQSGRRPRDRAARERNADLGFEDGH